MQRLVLVSCFALVAAVSTPAAADPRSSHKQVSYVGVHPIPQRTGGGFCNIEGPHVHIYLPDQADVLFRVVGGSYLFVGDPIAYGYDGERHAFYGPHPVPVDELVDRPHDQHDGTVFCYLEGPHYHVYVPPLTMRFAQRGGAYWYIGEWPSTFQTEGPRYAKINVVYKPLLYSRPVVTATAPVEYHVPEIKLVAVEVPSVAIVHVPWIVVEEDVDYDIYYYRPHRHRRHSHDED